jgi:outer membrane protein OmpA-like peptidoglycan-associated protein
MFKRTALGLGIASLAVHFGCATGKWAREDPWPKYPPPGSWKGVEQHAGGHWWMPSKIGPEAGALEGIGNRGVIFYAGVEKTEPPPPPPAPKIVEKIIYKAVPVKKEVHADRYIFPTIAFAEGSAELDSSRTFDEKRGEFASSDNMLKQAAELIKKSGSDKVFVEGNIDAAEKGKYSTLGQMRADAVKKALVSLGVDSAVLITKDYGATNLLSSSETDVGRALNRRVSFTVIPQGQSLEPETLVQPPAPEPGPNIKIVEKVVEKQVAVPELVIKDHIIFPNIYFEYDKAILTAEGLSNTNKAAEALKTVTGLKKVTVEGHCDARGSDEYNDKLSTGRAETVKGELVKMGLDAPMLEAVGYGERKPVASNETAEGMALNRRVEFELER